MWRQGEFRAAGARSAPKYHFRLTCGMSINENQPVVRLQSFLIACLWAIPATAGEGLWPYNQFPKDSVKQKLGFEVDSAFLDRLRLASVKLPGGSGAFVSPTGLLLTTRQLAADCLSGLSTPQHDYFRDGFQAAAEEAELPCPGMDASVLLTIEDVTEPVKAAGATLALRNAAIARIEKECAARSGNVCSVVRLFSGGRYDLYQYRRYRDLRLVFAPEYAIAFFGRERDSISYLRYGLHIAFLRAYENGRPAATPDYLKWSLEGVKEGDLVFHGGNPGPPRPQYRLSARSRNRQAGGHSGLPEVESRRRQRGRPGVPWRQSRSHRAPLHRLATHLPARHRAAPAPHPAATPCPAVERLPRRQWGQPARGGEHPQPPAHRVQNRRRQTDRPARRPAGDAQDRLRRQDPPRRGGQCQAGCRSRQGVGRDYQI